MTITTGQSMTKTYTVEEAHTASHIGSGSIRVLATPIMIAYMEITSMKLLDQHLDKEHTTVGTRVDVRHLAPSPLGAEIKVSVEVIESEGPKTTLKVEAWDGEKLVGTGTHWHYTINIEQFKAQLTDTNK